MRHMQSLTALECQFSMSSYRVSLLSRKLQGEGDRAQPTQINISLSPLLYPGSLHLLPSTSFTRDIQPFTLSVSQDILSTTLFPVTKILEQLLTDS